MFTKDKDNVCWYWGVLFTAVAQPDDRYHLSNNWNPETMYSLKRNAINQNVINKL